MPLEIATRFALSFTLAAAAFFNLESLLAEYSANFDARQLITKPLSKGSKPFLTAFRPCKLLASFSPGIMFVNSLVCNIFGEAERAQWLHYFGARLVLIEFCSRFTHTAIRQRLSRSAVILASFHCCPPPAPLSLPPHTVY